MQYRVTAVIDAVNLAPLIEALVPLSGKPLQISAYTGDKSERAPTRQTAQASPSQSLDDLLAPAPPHANYDPTGYRPPSAPSEPRAPTPAKRRRFSNPNGTAVEVITELLRTGPATTKDLRELVQSAGYAKATFDNTIWEMLKEGKAELVPNTVRRTIRLKSSTP